ncbi:oligosaccharyl transferase, archaeosortase A system-associated [Methanosarcina sp. KYL-1]|nr:oligosaccharyl transferase, archaeosortase A system-associated [Methanosarcina sp. KYL-1]
MESKLSTHEFKPGIISLFVVLAIALFMRMLSYSSVTANGGITFAGYDSFYHMRRILYSAANFPDYLHFDSYLNYPFGFEISWPPLYDLLGAGLALVLGAGNPDTHTVEFAGALLPVLLGILTLIPVYVAASALFDRKVGFLSAAVFALMPVHIYISQFGAADHHVAEVLFSTAAYAFFILALKRAKETSLSLAALKGLPEEKKLMEPVAFAGASGVCFALLVFTWIGAPVYIGFILLYFFVQATIDLKTGKKSEYLFICSAASLLTALLVSIPICAGAVRPGLEMSAMFLSWFQVFYILALLAGVVLLGRFSIYVSKKGQDWRYYPALILLASGAGLFLLRSFSIETYGLVIEAVKYFSGIGGFTGSISEAQPLFFTSEGKFTLSSMLGNFWLCFPVAFVAFFLLLLAWKGEKLRSDRVFFLLWTVFAAYLTLSQRRYSYLFSVNVAFLNAYFIMTLFESLDFENEVHKLFSSLKRTGNAPGNAPVDLPEPVREAGRKAKAKIKTKSRAIKAQKSKIEASNPDYFKLISALSLVIILLGPSVWIVSGYSKETTVVEGEWQESLQWLEASSPETSYYQEPAEIPEYGVLSWWDYGNWIVYMAKRPAVSNNFQTGVEDSARFLISDSEQEARDILDKHNVKYVITDTYMARGKFGHIAGFAGKTIEDYYDIKTVRNNAGLQTYASPKKELLDTEIYKLHELDGANLGNLRLIHESTDEDLETKRTVNSRENKVKVFEYVPGAVLSGLSSPGQPVRAELKLKSGSRDFTYYNSAVADEAGYFEITVPYPTENTAANADTGVYAVSAYSLTAGENSTLGIQVTEKDVMEGNKIELDFSTNNK